MVTGDSVDQVVADLNSKVASVRLAMVTGNVNGITQSQLQVTPRAVVSGAKGYSATATLLAKLDEYGVSLVVKLTKREPRCVSAGN